MPTEVTVPMVGKIVNVLCKAGDTVAEDDQIATLEAMKMEMPIVAPAGGVIKEVLVTAGQEVDADTVLAIIE
jgi:acetyl-CoA carboxylase biotin carboxyl carrier protein